MTKRYESRFDSYGNYCGERLVEVKDEPKRNLIDADELWDRLRRAAKGDPSPDRTEYWDGFHDAVNIVKQMMAEMEQARRRTAQQGLFGRG